MIQKRLSSVLKRRVMSVLLVAPIGLSFGSSTQAAEWRIEPLLRAAADFNDNP